MEKLIKIPTDKMSRGEWVSARMGSIGGSDAGALIGLNPYKSPYALWAEKTGKVPLENLDEKEAVRLGHDLEQYVAERWMEATGKRLRRENNILKNPKYPFAHANIDRAVVGEPNSGFEAKTTSSYDIGKQCRNGEFPAAWLCQVTHYMMVTGANLWYLGVLVFGQGFYHFEIQRNEDEIAALAAAEADFWRHVETDTPPETDGSEATKEALMTIYADGIPGESIDMTPEAADLALISAIRKQIADLENLESACKVRIMAYMGNAEIGEFGKYLVTWKNQSRSTFDRKSFEKDNGAIPKKYFKASQCRPMRISEKEEN